MNTRNRAWRRKKNFSKGRRKKRIAVAVCRNWWYEHDGQYIKGKIHCSCPSCSPKTNNHGHGAARNYTHSDLAKVESMQCKISEYKNGEVEDNGKNQYQRW